MRKGLLFAIMMASSMLSFGQSDISNKLSISTKMFIDERDGALEMKRHAVSEKQLGLEFVGKRIRPSKNDDRIYAAPDTIDGRVYISAFIRMENNADVKDLVNKGVQIQSSFNNGLYTALIPVERIEEVAKRLPNYNCGSCGFAGCHDMAEAIVTGAETNLKKCKPGKEDNNFKPILEYLDAHPNADGSKVKAHL